MVLSPVPILALHDSDSWASCLYRMGPFNILFLAHALQFYAYFFAPCILFAHSFVHAYVQSFIDSLIPHSLSRYCLPGDDDTKFTDMISALKILKFKYEM